MFVAADMDRSRRLTKKLIAKAAIVEFGGLAADGAAARRDGRRTAQEWLQEELTRSGRAIDADAARLLVSRAGHDITKLRGDVERLLLFTEGRRRISADDVMEVVADEQTVDDDWAVINAIAEGDPARALVETGRRFDRGDSPHQLLGQLRWWVSSRLAEGDASRVKPAMDALLRTESGLEELRRRGTRAPGTTRGRTDRPPAPGGPRLALRKGSGRFYVRRKKRPDPFSYLARLFARRDL